MNIRTEVSRAANHIYILVYVDEIYCGRVIVAGSLNPTHQEALDALVEGRMSLKDFAREVGRDLI